MDYSIDELNHDFPKRTEDIYKEIEQFEPYELTHCVVYEMAMRNKNVVEIYDKLKFMTQLLNNKPELLISSRLIITEVKPDSIDAPIFKPELKSKSKYKDIPLSLDLGATKSKVKKVVVLNKDQHDKIIDYYKKNIDDEYISMSEESYDKILEKNKIEYKRCVEITKRKYEEFINALENLELHYSELIEIIIDELEKDLIYNYHMYPEGYKKEILGAPSVLVQGNTEDYINNIDSKSYWMQASINDGVAIARGVFKDTKKHYVNNLILNFKRNVYDSEQLITPINFSLPINELVEYITHVKNTKTAKEKNGETMIASLIKLSGKEVQKTEKISSYPVNNTAFKMSDMFYIYDYVTARKNSYLDDNEDSIDNEIFNDVEAQIQVAYYLEGLKKDSLDVNNKSDAIFYDLIFPTYKSKFRIARIKYKKATIHETIYELCAEFSKLLSHAERMHLEKKYSTIQKASRKSKVFEDLELLLYKNYMEELHNKYSHIEDSERKKIFKNIELFLEENEISSSTVLNHYKMMRKYIEGDKPKYPELLTGERVIEDTEDEDDSKK